MLTLICAHPYYPVHSRVNRALRQAVDDLQGVRTRGIYTLYLDFRIDAAAEQAALAESRIIVLQHPIRWYRTPARLSLWFEKCWLMGATLLGSACKRCKTSICVDSCWHTCCFR